MLAQLIDNRCQGQQPKPQLQVEQDSQLSLDKERFANVLFHLIDNAQHATPDDGQITLTLKQNKDWVELSIQDTGCGMSDDFIATRLFKPFDSTKGNAGMGIGAYDAQIFVEQCGGQLLVHSKEGEGTTFTMRLPLN